MADDHQHYVPQFLLKGFSTGGKRNKQVWVFDKRDDKSYRTSVRNVASQGGFYDFSIGNERRSLDPALQRLESAVADDIRTVMQRKAMPSDQEARSRIAFFVAVQMVRTDAQRQQYIDLEDFLRREIEKRGGWAEGAARFPDFSLEESTAQAIQLIPHLARSAAPFILSKSWILYATKASDPFWIGDNPVTLDNNINEAHIPDRKSVVKGLRV